MLIAFAISLFIVLRYVFFSKDKKENSISKEDQFFLASDSTNTYIKGKDLYNNLYNDEIKVHFKGDH